MSRQQLRMNRRETRRHSLVSRGLLLRLIRGFCGVVPSGPNLSAWDTGTSQQQERGQSPLLQINANRHLELCHVERHNEAAAVLFVLKVIGVDTLINIVLFFV